MASALHSWPRLLRLYLRLLGAQARSQLRYRVSFAFSVVSSVLMTASEFYALVLVLRRFGGLDGWSLPHIALLYGLAEIGFALQDWLFGGFDPPNLSQHIRTGSFNTFLLRPLPLTLQVFGSDFALRRIARIFLALGIFGYGVAGSGVLLGLSEVALLLASVLGLAAFFGALFVVGGTLTFWTVDSLEVMNVLTYGGRTLISYPMSIYQEWLRRLFTFVLPAAFLSYLPVLHLLGLPFPYGLPAWTAWLSLPIGAAALAFALAFFGVGVRRYHGTGS